MDATNKTTLDSVLRQRLREAVSEARRREAKAELDGLPTPLELRSLREEAGMSVGDVATRLGVVPTYVSRIEGIGGNPGVSQRRSGFRDPELIEAYVEVVQDALRRKRTRTRALEEQRRPLSLREQTRWRFELDLVHRRALRGDRAHG